MKTPLKVVFFDVGGTILRVEPSVGHIYSEAVEELGFDVAPQEVNGRFRGAWKKSLMRRRDEDYVCSDEILRREWAQVVIDTFEGLVPRASALKAFDGLFDRFCNPDAWQLAPAAKETFQALGERVPLGILSNWDSRLEPTLEFMGVLDFFSHRVISYQVGHEKPHPRMFEEAVRQSGVLPEQILHVGDSREWDVQPARELGLQVIWVRGDATLPDLGEGDEPGAISVTRFDQVLPTIEEHFTLA
jgi:REG-2-like HAD superfamily hydrolase